MQFLFSRSQSENAGRASILRPLRRAYDAVELEIYFVERPKSDPLLGEMLWRDIAPIGSLSPEVRRELEDSGFRVGHTSSPPPPALETLLGLRAEISDASGPADQKHLVRQHVNLGLGNETEIQTSPYYPHLDVIIPSSEGVQLKTFENARCLYRIKAKRLQKGWVTLEFQPEIHHGQYGYRFRPSSAGWAGGTKQSVYPIFTQSFSVSLNQGEMVVLSADGKDAESLGSYFFHGHGNESRRQGLLIVRLAELPKTEVAYSE
ncbi:MAG: hypothetical protein IID46_07725 [Planctomycetes bacterium]|nr:hypothetical protein [Planctomycetota bacterium]